MTRLARRSSRNARSRLSSFSVYLADARTFGQSRTRRMVSPWLERLVINREEAKTSCSSRVNARHLTRSFPRRWHRRVRGAYTRTRASGLIGNSIAGSRAFVGTPERPEIARVATRFLTPDVTSIRDIARDGRTRNG